MIIALTNFSIIIFITIFIIIISMIIYIIILIIILIIMYIVIPVMKIIMFVMTMIEKNNYLIVTFKRIEVNILAKNKIITVRAIIIIVG